MRILIADDEAVSRHLLQKTLERAGYEVLAVENGIKVGEGRVSAAFEPASIAGLPGFGGMVCVGLP